jgi:hypothetical protein
LPGRFHQKDFMSQHILQEREKGRQEKSSRWSTEREKKKDDPNVEYIDMDDFKPGGKYGPPKATGEEGEGNTPAPPAPLSEELRKASGQVLEAVQPAGEKAATTGEAVPQLANTLWAELLD